MRTRIPSLVTLVRAMSTSTSASPLTMSRTPADPPACAQLLGTESDESREKSLKTASDLLHSHLPVAFPTETVYGLGASATSSVAVRRIFDAKGRPSDNPLIVHIGSREMLEQLLPRQRRRDGRRVVGINKMYEALTDKFWPGPLSLVFNLNPPRTTQSSTPPGSDDATTKDDEWDPPLVRVAPEVTANQPSICIRMPSHPLALALLNRSGLALAAPSANLSSRPSPTTARHVLDDLGRGRGVGAVIDGGSCRVGVESTVVDYLEPTTTTTTRDGQVRGEGEVVGRLRILRAGGVSAEDIEECLREAGFSTSTTTTTAGGGGGGIVQVYSRDFKSTSLESNPTTPGMKYKHYSPGNSKVVLVKNRSNDAAMRDFLPSLQELIQLSCLTQQKEGRVYRVGLMLTDETLRSLLPDHPTSSSSSSLSGDHQTEEEERERPGRVKLPEPRPSKFAQLTQGEESNLPELESIQVWSLPLSRSQQSHQSEPSSSSGGGGGGGRSTPSTTTVGQDAAQRLFTGLRCFDSMPREPTGDDDDNSDVTVDASVGVDLILVECVEETGVGLAVMERARKAAGGIERGGEMEFAL